MEKIGVGAVDGMNSVLDTVRHYYNDYNYINSFQRVMHWGLYTGTCLLRMLPHPCKKKTTVLLGSHLEDNKSVLDDSSS